MKVKLLLFYLLLAFKLSAQESAQDIKRFIYGLNAGVKFANRNYAIRYTGAYQNQLENFFLQQNNYQNIRQILGNKDFSFDSYSELYRYQPAPVYGINLGFQASRNLSFEADLNFSNIKFIGGYTLSIIEPGNFTTQDIFQNGTVLGQESRFNGRVNMNFTSNGEKIKGVVGISGLVNSWRMEENLVELNGGIITNLFSPINATNGFTSRVSGTGFGYGVNAGIEVPFKKGIVMQILYQPYITRMDYFTTRDNIIALGDDYEKPARRLEHDLIARFVWR